jgi:hypothetical protein
MTQALVKATTEKDALAILGAADDRELLDAAENDQFMPYDLPFSGRCMLVSVKAKANYDNKGLFITVKILESSAPNEVKPGKNYTVAYFDVHKTLPEFVLKQHLVDKREFARVIAGSPPDEGFKAAPVLLKLHREVESLDVALLFQNRFVKTTRNGKKIHHLQFALDKA